MNTIDNIMKLADEFRYARTYEWDASDAVEAGQALRTAVTELASTATEYQQAADKMAMDHKVERDTLTKRIAELESIEKQNSDTITLPRAVGIVLEGFTLPDAARKILETAYFADVALAQQAEQDPETAMIDAAMVEMKNIVPPLRRSECRQLIRAALAATHKGA